MKYCNFCGKPEAEVAKLIDGPNVAICDGCVELCVDILCDEPLRFNLKDLMAAYRSEREKRS